MKFNYQFKINYNKNNKPIDDEVYKYQISAEANEDVKPLDWQKTHSTEYPNLSKLTLDFLCIQASSVPYEQLFSIAS